MHSSRRVFLGAVTAASYQRLLGANDRIQLGFIGYGLIGRQHVHDFKNQKDADLAAMCEVCQPRLEEGLAACGTGAKPYTDFRKLLDNQDIQAIVVCTPDHWHALLTIMSCASGKDVYVEKPLTVFVKEGRWMTEAARRYKRVVQVGTQQRSGKHYQNALSLVRDRYFGKLLSARMGTFRNVMPGFGNPPDGPPPRDLNYDMWLGPAPLRAYNPHRALYHFRWFWDYSGGQMTNLGAHTIDQVLWCMNVKGPTMVMSTGGRFALEDDGETPDTQDAIWQFPGNFTVNYAIREANAMRGDSAARGQLYLGTKGSMVLAGNYEVIPENKIDPVNDIPRFMGQPIGGPEYSGVKPTPWIQPSKGGVESDARYGTGGEDTMAMNERDWLSSMRTRKRPLCEVEDGHRVAVACHLANNSLRLGRAIKWDPEKEQVIGDKEAAAMCYKPYRAPWDGVLKSLVKV